MQASSWLARIRVEMSSRLPVLRRENLVHWVVSFRLAAERIAHSILPISRGVKKKVEKRCI